MKVKNERLRRKLYEAAERSKDPSLGIAVLSIAEKWADLMDEQLREGADLATIIIETHQRATNRADGLKLHTQFGDIMVDYLEGCWDGPGKELSDWYNDR